MFCLGQWTLPICHKQIINVILKRLVSAYLLIKLYNTNSIYLLLELKYNFGFDKYLH